MSSEYEQLDVIAVGAHPDDVEIACGGTLAKLANQGVRCGIIDLTDGEPTPLSPGPEVRKQEAAKAAEILGVKRIILDLPNRRLFDSFEARCQLAIEFRKYRPKVVIGFGDKTPMASPDHYQAMLITDAAVFYSRLCKWPEHFDGLERHIIPRQLYFRLAFEPLATDSSLPRFTYDISDTIDQKIDAIKSYETQFPAEKVYVFDRVRAYAQMLGTEAGCDAGELFFPTKPILSNDFMSTLGLS